MAESRQTRRVGWMGTSGAGEATLGFSSFSSGQMVQGDVDRKP
jgi:hypothetical protein